MPSVFHALSHSLGLSTFSSSSHQAPTRPVGAKRDSRGEESELENSVFSDVPTLQVAVTLTMAYVVTNTEPASRKLTELDPYPSFIFPLLASNATYSGC